jgi:predicted ester cyclase
MKSLLFAFSLTYALTGYCQGTNNSLKEFTEKVRTNASTFHKNFSTGSFEKNGPLVTENIYVNSNNAVLIGRENFVNRIKRYNGPFPGLQLKDRIVLIDGNVAAVHYILQGVQKGTYGPIPASGNQVEAMSAEFFEMNGNALMKNLLTITQLDKLEAECKGDLKIDNYQEVVLLPIAHQSYAFKMKLKDIMDEYMGAFNARKWDELGALIDDNVTINWNGEMGSGKPTLIQELQKYLAAIPDLTLQPDRNVADGDRGAIAYTMQGKQAADLMINGKNIHSSGKMIMVREAEYFQFDKEGKIINVIAVSNSNDFITQLK